MIDRPFRPDKKPCCDSDVLKIDSYTNNPIRTYNTLIFVVTTDCNLNCSYCRVARNSSDPIAVETVQIALNNFMVEKSLIRRIRFFGGEPLLFPETIISSVEAIKKTRHFNKGHIIDLTTNGLLLGNEFLEYIGSEPQFELYLSIDDEKNISNGVLHPTIHEKLESLLKLQNLTINLTVGPDHVNTLYSNYRALRKMGFNQFKLLPAFFTDWPAESIAALEAVLKTLADDAVMNSVLFRNVDIHIDLPLFENCIVVLPEGDLFGNNIFLTHPFSESRNEYRWGNILNTSEIQPVPNPTPDLLINSALGKSTSGSTEKVNKLLTGFVERILGNESPVVNHVEELSTNTSYISNDNLRLDVKLNFTCNNMCRFCVQGDKRHKKKGKTTEEIKDLLTENSGRYKEVVFTGGEITIRPDIVEIVKHATGEGYEIIQMQTNGRMFSDLEFCKKMISAGANDFGLSLHGHCKEVHEGLTRAKGSFAQTIKGIRNLTGLGQSVKTNTVITKQNYRNLPDMAKIFCLSGVTQFQLAFVHILGSAYENRESIVPRKSEIMPYVMEALDTGIKYGVSVMTEAIPYCLMSGYEDYVAERIIPETKIYDADQVTECFSKVRKEEGKIKHPKCESCRRYSVCEGPWREYPDLYGWDEFIPVP